MTRENKLALIIGFSLILVVAILITDHLSPANSDLFADLGADSAAANSSLNLRGSLPAGNGAGQPEFAANQQSTNTSSTPNRNSTRQEQGRVIGLQQLHEVAQLEPESDPELETIEMGIPLNQNRPIQQANDRLHTVRRNESLYGITRQYYGDEKLARQLANYNQSRVTADLQLREGVTLRIPERWVLTNGTPPAQKAPAITPNKPKPAPAPKYTTYTIQSNDILGVVSKKLLGTSKRWREIYELNKDIIDDPDRLIPGDTIRIPPRR